MDYCSTEIAMLNHAGYSFVYKTRFCGRYRPARIHVISRCLTFRGHSRALHRPPRPAGSTISFVENSGTAQSDKTSLLYCSNDGLMG